MALTSKQKALLHIAPQRLGIDADTRLDIQADIGGARSSKHLDYQGFLAVMRYYEGCGFECNLGPEPGKAHRPGMATDKQIKKIYALWWSLGAAYYKKGQERKALRGFLKKRFRVDHENFLSFKKAHNVIEAIKSIETRGAYDASSRPGV